MKIYLLSRKPAADFSVLMNPGAVDKPVYLWEYVYQCYVGEPIGNHGLTAMSYFYDYVLKNVGGRETVERIDLHDYTSLNLNQRWINHKLITTCKLTDTDGYALTLDFDDRPAEAFVFLAEWREATKSRRAG